jgi:hypothetical protein
LLEALEDRTLLSPLLTVANVAVSGSNGAVVTNTGNWDPTTEAGLTASAGTITAYDNGTWNWSETTPMGAARTAPVTIYARDSQGNKLAGTEFWLNVGQVFVVTNNLDDGSTGSLRWAITQVDNDLSDSATQPDLIAFNINASGVQTIQVGSSQAYSSQPLRPISSPVIIDGFTQPGASPNTQTIMGPGAGNNACLTITLDGSNISSQVDGLAIAAGNSTVQGLVIQNFYDDIHLTTNGNDTISGNNLTNGAFVHGTNSGVFVDNVANNTIGGVTPGTLNVIGGGTGILMQGPGATGNQVQGDYIGTDGSQLLSSGFNGVIIQDGSDNNVVGGTATGAGNVISPHGWGIWLNFDGGVPVSGNLVQGNYIGTNAAGNAVPTGVVAPGTPGRKRFAGVIISNSSSDNTIGGATSSAGNVISGWNEQVLIGDPTGVPAPTGNVVAENFIGTTADGSAALGPFAQDDGIDDHGVNTTISGNLISGVGIGAVLSGTGGLLQGNLIGKQSIPNGVGVVGGNNNLIEDNTIANATSDGIDVGGGGNVIKGNSIFGNQGSGVSVTGTGDQIEGNSIYGNQGPAVWVQSDPFGTADPFGPFSDGGVSEGGFPFIFLATSVSIQGNSIYGNGGLGIALGNTAVDVNGNPLTLSQVQASVQSNPGLWDHDVPNGVVANDSLGHVVVINSQNYAAGANYFQDFPVLTSAVVSGSNVTVSGTLNTSAGTAPFTVDVYASPTADPSYYGHGQYDLGAFSIPPVSNPFSYTFSTANLPPALLAAPWYISATATDNGGNTSEFSKDVCIPVANVTGPSLGVPGQPRTFTLSANASALDQPAGFTFVVNWGDGTMQTVQGLSGVKVDHVYTVPGTFTMSVTATDLDRGTSSAVTQAISVQPVVMEGNSLAVGGTLGYDTITLTPADTTGDITVNLNGTTSFNGVTTFKPTDHILVYGQTGNDTIKLASTTIKGKTDLITVPAFLYGGGTGTDNDTLDARGSSANNVLVGGAGKSNTLYGGQGRDLLIAGLAASQLKAGSAGDILIGGSTDYDLTSTVMTYDTKLAALEAIMAEWGSADSYTTRVNDLSNGGGLNGSYLLNTSTVHDNGQADTLSGFSAAGPLDWFFASAANPLIADTIKHQNSGEVTTPIQ